MLTVVSADPLAVALCLPATGSWWNFVGKCWACCAPSVSSLMPLKKIVGAVPPYDTIQWAELGWEWDVPGVVPLVVQVDTSGNPVAVIDWSALAFTLPAQPKPFRVGP